MDDAIDDFERASMFYACGSWPHLKSNADAQAALEQARLAYATGAELLSGNFEAVQIPFEGDTFGGYLFTPEGDGPFPAVVSLNGTDVVKEQLGYDLPRSLLAHGIAVLLVDLAGVGDSGDYTLTFDIEKLPLAATDYLHSHAGIDPDRIGMMGVSIGGQGAARALFNQDAGLKAIVSHCAPLDFAYANAAALVPQLPQLPQLTVDGYVDNLNLAAGSTAEDLGTALEAFAFSAQNLVNEPPVSTPLLVVTTNDDPVAPLEDLALITGATTDSTVVVLDETGLLGNERTLGKLAGQGLRHVLIRAAASGRQTTQACRNPLLNRNWSLRPTK
ncbi:alpha/beta fold hydrolase [Celeribacter baekdonensis]|nr:alpha/beta fold hydrolase [Celeribacter baekdonensis]